MKKAWIIASVSIILLFVALQFYLYYSGPISNEELKSKVANLPHVNLVGLDGTEIKLDDDSDLVLIYFNSECDHCQREIREICANINLFDSTRVVMMSSQSVDEIQKFVSEMGFEFCPTIIFARIDYDQLAEAFGALAVPQIFVYSSKGQLKALFSGETKAGVIAGAINQ